MDRAGRWAPLLAVPLLLIAGLFTYLTNRDLRPVFWDEFLWRPEILRVARDLIPAGDWRALLHPTEWQYPPLYFLFGGGVVSFLGESAFHFRLLSILSSALLAPLAFLAGRKAGGLWTAIFAGLIALSLPISHRFGGALLVDPFQTVLISAALLLFVRAEADRRSLLPAAVFAALAGATKYTSLLLPVALIAALLYEKFRRADGPERRGWREIVLFGAIGAAPILFLRGSDLSLLREMTAWRSLPFDWGEFFKLVPASLLLLAVVLPVVRQPFPRVLRGPGFFLILWALFFFWRRQQMNWFLPAALPLALIAGSTLARLAGVRRWRITALLLAAVVLLHAGVRSINEVRLYRERERVYTEAATWVNRRVPPGDLVVIDALPFASDIYIRSIPCDVRNVRYEEGHYAILLPWVFENYKIRGFRGSAWGEVHESRIRDEWTLEKEYFVGGEKAVEVYANPRWAGRGKGKGEGSGNSP